MALAGSPRRTPEAADGLRLPPHSVEAEQAVLGGLMLDASAWDSVADVIHVADFYRRDHQLIFGAIAELVEAQNPCDAVTVSETLSGKGLVDEIGGLAYLARLTRDTPSASNVRAYAGIVRDHALLRELVQAGGEIASSALETRGRAPGELVEEAERRVFEIAERGLRSRRGFQSIKDVLPQTIDRIDMLHQNPGAFTGIPTGYTDLDRLTAGLQAGDLIVIAGRPSMGKTTLAVNIAEYAAIERKVPAAIFSMEMSAEQVTLRMISSLGRVSQGQLRTGALSAEDWPRITSATEVLSQAPIFIDETPSLTPTEVRARARRLKREKGLGLIVVDYLQLMQVTGSKENRATEISEISRSLKALAKELQLPVIALSQLNRSVEQRVEKRPVMSDLRECVTGDTLVLLADGGRTPIRQLVGERPRVLAMDAQSRLVAAASDKVWSVGLRPVFEVSLAQGRRIRATARHRLYTAAGWRTVAELRRGDRMAVASTLLGAACTASNDTLYRTLAIAAGQSWAPEVAVAASIGSAGSDFAWEEVLAIEPAGAEEVFDLTVPGPASWLADGIVSHNSGAIEQDADVILLIYREEVYEPNTSRKGIADIIVAKQRNGPTGEVHLTFLGEYTRFENLVAESYGEGVFR
ncbi:MAG TPA: replicative DNA helicase [Steroidobacteraceae bacterium]|nr:replicative DNA helicase [Steroidobacteraceae bacterium]